MCGHIQHVEGECMVNMTLSIPKELRKKMRQHTEFKWSDIARQAFEKKLREIELADKLLSKSKLTEENAERIGHAIKAKMRKRLGR
jgi:rhamnose utilization protein RhaD (predicted bifunctional aldolase and dehydrogenase)